MDGQQGVSASCLEPAQRHTSSSIPPSSYNRDTFSSPGLDQGVATSALSQRPGHILAQKKPPQQLQQQEKHHYQHQQHHQHRQQHQQSFNSTFNFVATPALYSDNPSGSSDSAQLNRTSFSKLDSSDTKFNNPQYLTPASILPFVDTFTSKKSLIDHHTPSQSLSPTAPTAHMVSRHQTPTSPHFLGLSMPRQSSSPHESPGLSQGQFQLRPTHSRIHSLDYANAMFPNGQGEDWTGLAAFRGHRKTYSDAHSDISSAHQSPYIASADDFDIPLENHSSIFSAQDQSLYKDVMGLGHVSLSEANSSSVRPALSPNLSSASLSQQLASANYLDSFDISAAMDLYDGSNIQTSDVQIDPLAFSDVLISNDPSDHVDLMAPPQITFEPAPPTRQASFEVSKLEIMDASALNPPERPRGRAKSDPFSTRGPNVMACDLLSPHSAGVGSRSPSPSSKNRRSSTSSVPNRDYILDLADPTRPTSSNSAESGTNRKMQKHPATFQCSLCPKRFTRAYNLRSHLRTHTDERPFVCRHCKKAFARQHDRKRHESLHSGERKFDCCGLLKDGNPWGCGRKFARADALGRHFRSEAGRLCIKPLMHEEAMELAQPALEAGSDLGISILPMPNQLLPQPDYDLDMSQQRFQPAILIPTHEIPWRLPAAILQQYPTLGNIWDNLHPGGLDEAASDINDCGSFDASSTGELDDEDFLEGHHGAAFGWASDVGA